jgi:RHS repeat-associated protein
VSNDVAYSWAPSSSSSTTTAQFNGANQLIKLGSSTVSSDPRGKVASGLDNRSYTFDLLGQLRGSTGGTGTVTVDYDPSGMLRRTVGPSGTVQYLYDGPDLIAQYDGSGNLLRRYVHGAGMDEPLVWYEGSQTSARRYLHADERGSIIAVSDNAGVAAASVKYSPQGESAILVSAFGYTGQLYLPDLQLYYYKARMYSPKAGRFLQPDPIGYGDGMNLYPEIIASGRSCLRYATTQAGARYAKKHLVAADRLLRYT